MLTTTLAEDHGRYWPELRALSPALAVNCADTYRYLGVVDKFFKLGFHLHPNGKGTLVRDGVAKREASPVLANSTETTCEKEGEEYWPEELELLGDIRARHSNGVPGKHEVKRDEPVNEHSEAEVLHAK